MDGHPAEAVEVEELAFAVSAMEMMDRHLDEPAANVLELANHFDADGARGRFERDGGEGTAPDEAEIAIHIAQPNAEQEPGELVIEAADHNAMQWVGNGAARWIQRPDRT